MSHFDDICDNRPFCLDFVWQWSNIGELRPRRHTRRELFARRHGLRHRIHDRALLPDLRPRRRVDRIPPIRRRRHDHAPTPSSRDDERVGHEGRGHRRGRAHRLAVHEAPRRVRRLRPTPRPRAQRQERGKGQEARRR